MIRTATNPLHDHHHHRQVDACYHLLEKSSDDDDTNETGEGYQQEQQAKVAPFECEGMVDDDEHATMISLQKRVPSPPSPPSWSSIPMALIMIIGFLRVMYLITMPVGHWVMRHHPTMMTIPQKPPPPNVVHHRAGIEEEWRMDVHSVSRERTGRVVPGPPSSASSVKLLSTPATVIKLRGGSKKTY